MLSADSLFSMQWLLGEIVSRVEHDAPARVWTLAFRSGASLSIPSLWRLLEADKLTTTSEDHGHTFGKLHPFDALAPLSALQGKAVCAVALSSGTSDLKLHFSPVVALEVINTSAGFEGWHAVHPTLGSVFVACGGEMNAIQGA